MTATEKLIELVHDARMNALWHNAPNQSEYITDMLIANDVTVQEWIPVKDRLPYLSEEEIERIALNPVFCPEFNVMILGATAATTLSFDGVGWCDEEGRYYRVTHWMPLPEPPKGE